MGMAPAPAPIPKKKISPVVWVLIGIAGFMLLVAVAIVGAGIFVAKKIVDNPALAAATAIAAANPDVEVVSTDKDGGTVTFKEKSTGKTVTLNLDQLKNGKLSFTQDGKEVSISANSGQAKLPGWVPPYPGAQLSGSFSARNGDEESVNVGFTTKDGAEKVVKFYQDAFKGSGLKVTNTSTQEATGTTTAMIAAESEDGRRSVVANVTSVGGETTVGLSVTSK